MEKKQNDARNSETEKKPGAADHQAQSGSATPGAVTDVELSNETMTTEKTATGKADSAGRAEATAAGAAGGSVPPGQTNKAAAAAENHTSSASKSTKGPLVGALVVVAAIAAGGYYYSQNNQSVSESSDQTSSEAVSSGSSSASSTSASSSDAQQSDQTSVESSSTDAQPGNTSESAGTADSATSAPTSNESQSDADSKNEGAASGSSTAADSTSTPEADNSTATPTTEQKQDGEQQVSGDTSSETASAGASDAAAGDATTSATDTVEAVTPAAPAETSPTAGPAATSEARTESATGEPEGAAANPVASGFTGSLPADIRDQLDRQSAQIIALRDQLESSQKQLQQLQSTRLQAARDETSLFVVNDVSRLVTMAQNELAIAGNLDNALASLETAMKAIDQADAPVLAGLRGALAADIVTLKSAPVVSVDAQFAQVAALVEQMATLPMLTPDQAGAKPMAGQVVTADAPQAVSHAATDSTSAAWYERAWDEVKTWPAAAWDGLRSDLGGIVRVEKLADPNQALFTVDQAAQLRANLQQHLHFAQQALLNGQQGIWTTSLETVVKGVKQSFNPDSVQTQQTLAQLQQLLQAGVRPAAPPITQSVKAVQETRKQLKSVNPGQE